MSELPSDKDIRDLASRTPYSAEHLRWVATATGITDINRLEEAVAWMTAFGGWIDADMMAEMVGARPLDGHHSRGKTYAEAVEDLREATDRLIESTGMQRWLVNAIGWLALIGEMGLKWCDNLHQKMIGMKNSLK